MSTEIGDVIGRKEADYYDNQCSPLYTEKRISVTSFWGGEHGVSVQLTLGSDYIMLNKKQAKRLIKLIKQSI
jgi:hypothetical protein